MNTLPEMIVFIATIASVSVYALTLISTISKLD